jgi:hypothetical protein
LGAKRAVGNAARKLFIALGHEEYSIDVNSSDEDSPAAPYMLGVGP